MAIAIGKLAPTAVVVAAVSCCGWPYVFPADEGGKQAAAMPAIDASQLSPHIGLPPARDPFRPAGEHVAQIAKVAKTTVAAKTGAKRAIASKSGPAARGKPPALSSLTLSATSILAEQRMAVINGRIYAERERLKSNDPLAPPCVVARILPDRVILECEGRTATLSYANVRSHAKAKQASGPAEPSGHGAPSGHSEPLPQPQLPAELNAAVRAAQQVMENVTKTQQTLEDQLEEIRK